VLGDKLASMLNINDCVFINVNHESNFVGIHIKICFSGKDILVENFIILGS